MATCSLRFYKNSRLKPEKNWIFDTIEDYLATLTHKDVSDYQYQRFEIEKEIRVNLTQNEQTMSTSADKYDYLRISTTISNTPIYYYYFIVKTKQVSESTIAYQLRMDTLNTFKFSSTAANGNYTLSPKTLVKREHKDRFHKIGGSNYFIMTAIVDKTNFNLFKNHVTHPVTNKSLTFVLNLANMNVTSPTWFYFTNYSSPIFVKIYKNGVVDSSFSVMTGIDSIYFDPTGLVKFYDYANNVSGASLFYMQDYDWNVCTLEITLDRYWETWGIYARPDEVMEETFADRILPYIMENRKDMLLMDVNEYQEGLSTILFKKDEAPLIDGDGDNQWYVVYASANGVVQNPNDTNAIYVNPVNVRFYCDKGYSLSVRTAVEVKLYATSTLIPKWRNVPEYISYTVSPAPAAGTQYVKIAGTTYDFHDYNNLRIKRTNNNDVVFSSITLYRRADQALLEFTNVESVIFYGINNLLCADDWYKHTAIIAINSGANTYSGSCDSWANIDLTDPRLIKAFAYPYAPCEFLVGATEITGLPDGVIFSADNVLELSNPQTPLFSYQKLFEVENPQFKLIHPSVTIAAAQSKNIELESKLLHSDYYQPKFVYDSFSFPFYLEDIDTNQYLNDPLFENFLVGYVVSRNIQSKFMFSFPQYTLKRSRQDYDNILCVERNNEKALYNNSYINYIKSGGYSYDTKKASSQNAVNGVTTALSIVGSVASFAGGIASENPMMVAAGVGLAVSAAAGIIRNVHTAQEQDRAIAQKIMQAHMQGTSVQGSEDIDILTAFSGNKAKLAYYELSDVMKSAMYDLFYYCGYATHEQKIPDVTTRMYFNFVQAEIEYKSFNFNEDIAQDIKERWNEGVTFFHVVSGSYDLDQQYENFETSLL